MRSQKSYIILIVVLVIFALIMYLLVAKNNIKEEKKTTTILVGDTSIWNYSSKRWVNVEKQSTIDYSSQFISESSSNIEKQVISSNLETKELPKTSQISGSEEMIGENAV